MFQTCWNHHIEKHWPPEKQLYESALSISACISENYCGEFSPTITLCRELSTWWSAVMLRKDNKKTATDGQRKNEKNWKSLQSIYLLNCRCNIKLYIYDDFWWTTQQVFIGARLVGMGVKRHNWHGPWWDGGIGKTHHMEVLFFLDTKKHVFFHCFQRFHSKKTSCNLQLISCFHFFSLFLLLHICQLF